MNEQQQLTELRRFRDSLTSFMLTYKSGIDEIMTKINILKTEFELSHEYSPIEHVTSRLKTPESIIHKMQRLGGDISLSNIKENITDVAGIRVVCSFITDVYNVAEMLTTQRDITVVTVKDYIKNPKPNGYKSLHLIVKVPVFFSKGVEEAYVEIQIRTIAMDFWASLEHKIYYKFEQAVPEDILAELAEAAHFANQLDLKMERIHDEVSALHPVRKQEASTDIVLPPTLSLKDLFSDK